MEMHDCRVRQRKAGHRDSKLRIEGEFANGLLRFFSQTTPVTSTPPSAPGTTVPRPAAERVTSELPRRDRNQLLLGPARRLDRNGEEDRYDSHVRDSLLQLLKGERDRLELLVKYHREPGRLGILTVPRGINARELRPAKAEETLKAVLRFLHDGGEGGPAAGAVVGGARVQIQDFSTRFPHIVIERSDYFEPDSEEVIKTCWAIKRLQNQQSSINANRTLDAIGLGLDILKFVL